MTPLLESECWSSGSGGLLGRQAEGRREVGPERGGEAGAVGQGGRHHLRLSENPASGPHQAGTGWQVPDRRQVEESVAQRPPRGSSQVHDACGEDGTHGQRTETEEAKVPVEPQPG